MDKYVGNTFVVSRLGQLRNVQNFIKQYNAEKNVLVIQYTARDDNLLKSILQICDSQSYLEIVLLKLPNRPLNATKKKNMKIYSRIKKKLEYIDEKYEFNNLFLCNTDNWYSYYEKIKSEDDFQYTINLLEEGLTTYMVSSTNIYEDQPIHIIKSKDVKKSFRSFKKATKKSLRALKTAFKQFGIVILDIISLIFRTNLHEKFRQYTISHNMDEKYKFEYIKHFDEAIVCLPDKIQENNFSIGDIKQLNFQFNDLNKEELPIELNENYGLFINQKYINYKQHWEIIFKILSSMDVERFYIKLHPRENKNKAMEAIDECNQQYENLNAEVITTMDSVPIEDVLYNFKFKQIIGLTSSSLIYCNELIDDDLDIISIASKYREMCYDKDNDVNTAELKLFEREYKYFNEFSNVKQY